MAINRKLARINEFRRHRKAILAKYGENVEIVDSISSWSIQQPEGKDIYGFMRYKTLWTGAKLCESVGKKF